mmetsp:Transcript_48131/g.89207  ORF Transcript_48131/g.89207 Transcript_48131/m.89207 type:complete len:224 (+) Transcript_48131:1927-2598(+)
MGGAVVPALYRDEQLGLRRYQVRAERVRRPAGASFVVVPGRDGHEGSRAQRVDVGIGGGRGVGLGAEAFGPPVQGPGRALGVIPDGRVDRELRIRLQQYPRLGGQRGSLPRSGLHRPSHRSVERLLVLNDVVDVRAVTRGDAPVAQRAVGGTLGGRLEVAQRLDVVEAPELGEALPEEGDGGGIARYVDVLAERPLGPHQVDGAPRGAVHAGGGRVVGIRAPW